MALIVGRKSILEALQSETELEQIYLQHGLQGGIIDRIRTIAKRNGIRVSEIPKSKFDEIAKGTNHQGVAAVRSSVIYWELDQLLKTSKQKSNPLFLMLDSIQDPHNLGAILRTAECFGVDGIILTMYKSVGITSTVEKISAGALSFLKICKVTNLVNAIRELKQNGFWIYGSTLENAVDFKTINYSSPSAIVVGNEEKGIRPLVAKNCDQLIKIPMSGNLQSLNVSVATGVLLSHATELN
ncbi:MAG: 23S rRNA (guanosine(2251)-2'-O)-methyltransferase RlmB [Melioribacteraceae bacterium]|nr:23S rRNA (guanosine(2251)-2'-O)-methyltransferase RlmB [Melioribacteraceae bacterium]MCF8413888.1 23S rRNA (guanosine(2251)-2'-O)-methyltransferase RlmB [Melioribacteraceae bacterium]